MEDLIHWILEALIQIIRRVHIAGPVVIEVLNDRKGDTNKTQDVYFRALFCVFAGLLDVWANESNVFAAIGLAISFFILTFDYCCNKWIKVDGVKRPVFSYLSAQGVDAWPWWRALGWGGRLIARILLFGLTLWPYILTLK